MAEDIYVQKTIIEDGNESTEQVKLLDVLKRVQLLDFVLSTIYAFTGGMARIPRQVLIPKIINTYPNKTLKGKAAIIYSLDSGVEGEFEIYNYTDLVVVEDSQFTVTDDSGNWIYACGPEVSLTEGKDYSIRGSRKTGSGNNKFYIEAGSIIVSYE